MDRINPVSDKPQLRRHRVLFFVLAFLLPASISLGEGSTSPLKPPDRSSPRATIQTFLESADNVGAFVASEYMNSPSRAGFAHLRALIEVPVSCLDLSEVPPAATAQTGPAAATALYETLSRIELPPLDTIPGSGELAALADGPPSRWILPDTGIALVRIKDGPQSGQYLFSADTVGKAGSFYEKVRALPYTRSLPLEHMIELQETGGGWLIPFSWIKKMPSWLRADFSGQALWKWLALVPLLVVFGLLLGSTYRFSRSVGRRHLFLQALARLALPAFFLAASPAFAYLALVQINFGGRLAGAVELAASAVIFVAGAWISWRAASAIAEAIIASPRIAPQSIDAHLIRICTRLIGIAAGAGLLVLGADRLGIPVYGVIAGLGVGGLAIALAAQPTIENLIGGFSLFADKPIRVGDLCTYNGDRMTVEAIGIRSTRLRGRDRTLTTVPNAELSKIPIVNLTQRDRILSHFVIGVRYETSPEQLRFLLVKARELLLSLPRIHPKTARARFTGFGESSLNIEIFAQVMTRDDNEFFAIQEDLLLRLADLVNESGTGFAFPSQTLYFGRDGGLDREKTTAAEEAVREWRTGERLPFPDFPPEELERLRESLTCPPSGSPGATGPATAPGMKPPTDRGTQWQS